jgi:hypothetical protein
MVPTPLSTHADNFPGAAKCTIAAGIESVPMFVLVSPTVALRLEAKLGDNSELDSGLGRLTVDGAPSEFRVTDGAGWRIPATKQFRTKPAIAEESELLPNSPLARGDIGDALGAIEDPS